MANAGASHISMDLGLSGPVYTISTACSSANHAIGQAFRLARDAQAELAVTGGAEAIFTVGMLKAWEAMRVISPDTCRPFSKDRRGMILGEGGAMMNPRTLRRGESARRKNLRRNLRPRHDVRCSPSDAAYGRRPSARHASRPARSGPCGGSFGIHQCPRHRNGRKRSGRIAGYPRSFRRRTRTSSASAPPSQCTATLSARRARWRR